MIISLYGKPATPLCPSDSRANFNLSRLSNWNFNWLHWRNDFSTESSVFLSCTKQVSFGSSEPPKVLRVAPFKEFEGSYDTWTQWFGKRRCLRYSNGVTAVSLLTSIKAQSGFGEAPQVRSQFLSLSNNRVCNFPSSLLYLLLSPWWPWGRHATTSVCVHLDVRRRFPCVLYKYCRGSMLVRRLRERIGLCPLR
jgi:hypothetical protein